MRIRDWSSDGCSSDLPRWTGAPSGASPSTVPRVRVSSASPPKECRRPSRPAGWRYSSPASMRTFRTRCSSCPRSRPPAAEPAGHGWSPRGTRGSSVRGRMFLKTLTMKGFKSFADTTALELEPGVTVVVGPNGSGKSNVVDAIGWVLGAQAPSSVRSQTLDDVIFAGTAKPPQLGRAEVALTNEHPAGLLPIQFTEVHITPHTF